MLRNTASVVLGRPFAGGEAAGLDLAARVVARRNAGTGHIALSEASHRIRDGAAVHHHARMVRGISQHDRPFLSHLFMHGRAGHRLGIIGRHGHRVRGEHSNCGKYDDRLHGASFGRAEGRYRK